MHRIAPFVSRLVREFPRFLAVVSASRSSCCFALGSLLPVREKGVFSRLLTAALHAASFREQGDRELLLFTLCSHGIFTNSEDFHN